MYGRSISAQITQDENEHEYKNGKRKRKRSV